MDRLARLEARVEELALAVEDLAAHVRGLEGRLSPETAGEGARQASEVSEVPWERQEEEPVVARPPRGATEPAPPAGAPEVGERWGPVALLGRTLMVLGGAYLFRALTEAGSVRALVGVGLGLAYALVWLVFSDRAASRGNPLSASFHGAAFALIAAPLAWEAASRFQVFSATEGAAALAILTGLALAVAWRRDLRAVAWLASLAGLLAAWALMGSVAPVLPAAAVLILIAVADDWVAHDRGWLVLPWATAAAADVTLTFMLLGEVLGESAVGRGGAATGLALLLLTHFVLHAASAVARAVRGRWRVRWLDLLQLPAATLLGYGGAFLLAQRADPLRLALGFGSLVAGVAALAAMRRLFERRAERRPAYVFFAWAGLVLVLGGTALLLPPGVLAGGWSALAVGLALLASRHRSVTLGVHAAVYGTAAAVVSGLLSHAGHAFAASGSGAWPPLRPSAWLVLVGLAVTASLDLPAVSPFWGRVEARLPKLLLLAVLAWAALGVACSGLVTLILGTPGTADVDPAALALLRMAVVAAAALLLAWLGRFHRYREAGWLVYPVLVAGGFKLVLEDFLLGRAAELFGALALYGAVLIVAPRLARSGHRSAEPAEATEAVHPTG